MEYLIQTPGRYNYPGLDKPVEFTSEFLETLTDTQELDVEDEHNGPVVAKTSKILFRDNGLWMDTPTLNSTKRGFSTTIKDYVLVDMGEFYRLKEGKLGQIAVTDNPKDVSTLLYNSDDNKNNDGDVNMTNEEIDSLKMKIGALKQQITAKDETITNLQNEVSSLKTQKDDLKKNITDRDDQITALTQNQKDEAETIAKELAGEDEDLLNVYSQMTKEQLLTIQKKSSQDLAKELAGEDEDLLRIYGRMTPKQLGIIKEKGYNPDTGFNGSGDAGADDQDDGNNPSDDTQESYEDWKAKNSNWSVPIT